MSSETKPEEAVVYIGVAVIRRPTDRGVELERVCLFDPEGLDREALEKCIAVEEPDEPSHWISLAHIASEDLALPYHNPTSKLLWANLSGDDEAAGPHITNCYLIRLRDEAASCYYALDDVFFEYDDKYEFAEYLANFLVCIANTTNEGPNQFKKLIASLCNQMAMLCIPQIVPYGQSER